MNTEILWMWPFGSELSSISHWEKYSRPTVEICFILIGLFIQRIRKKGFMVFSFGVFYTISVRRISLSIRVVHIQSDFISMSTHLCTLRFGIDAVMASKLIVYVVISKKQLIWSTLYRPVMLVRTYVQFIMLFWACVDSYSKRFILKYYT